MKPRIWDYNMLFPAALLLFWFSAAPAFSQQAAPKPAIVPEAATVQFNTNTIPYRWGLGFLSGAARGLNQVIAFHPDRFFARHPNANRQYWDNRISWRNKHKNGNPEEGPAFPFSRSAMVFLTDGLHMSGTASNVTGVVSLSIPLYSGSGKKFKHYAAEAGFSVVGYWMGFPAVYNLWFP